MENNQKNRIYKVTMLVILTAIITFMVTSIGMYNYFSNLTLSQDTDAISNKIEKVKRRWIYWVLNTRWIWWFTN